MTTIIYTKDGIIQYIQSNGTNIPADPLNRDYRKIMAQDATSPFERVETIDSDPQIPIKSLEEQIADIRAALFEMEGI